MKVIVATYNSQWPDMFMAEAERIKNILGKELISIHHIGSTSVPGLKAKPIIDIMPVVRNIEVVDKLTDDMINLGYESMGEFGIPGRRYFRKGKDKRTHHIHIFQYNSKDVERHLAFRDYLRIHTDDAKKYGELKAQLASRFPDDIEAYMDGKDSFIKKLEKRAITWYRNVVSEGIKYDRKTR